jgi:3-oxoacyl-[acyl-carrier-protein] synthase II
VADGKRWILNFNQSTVDKVNPFFLLESICNNLFSFLSAFYELMGSNTTLASHSPYGGNALELTSRSIAQGKADIGVAVGCGNWITEIPLYEMEGLGILSRCKEGIHSYRPFDRKRDGFIPGEGGAALFLEASEIAERRGAKVWGKVNGTALIGN